MAALKSRFISHGTLGSKDLERTREFYEQFLGLEVVRTSPVSLMVRQASRAARHLQLPFLGRG